MTINNNLLYIRQTLEKILICIYNIFAILYELIHPYYYFTPRILNKNILPFIIIYLIRISWIIMPNDIIIFRKTRTMDV